MATLIVMSGPGVDNYYPLGRRTTVVGRDEGVLVQVLDPHCSRKHFQILFKPETELYYVLDMRSRHGTLVNGEKVGSDREKPLCNNDVITAGGTTILFTTRDFPDRHSALAYRKQAGQREEATLRK
jgi:pSer/pThr/pTyr-binding forkhead associated (FHA) protein